MLNPKTAYHHFRYLNHFFDHQQKQGKIIINPFDSFTYCYPNVPDKERNTLTQAEIGLLYRQAEPGLEEALLALAYGCGLRAGEIERLNMEDVNFSEHLLIVKQGKNNKRRVVPLAGKVSAQLEYYLQERLKQEADTRAFLLHSREGRFRHYTGNKVLKRLVERTKNTELQQKEISLHVLRHSIATHLIEEGLSLEKVRDFLGHANIETTAIYTHISQQQINKLVISD
jgi:integrase/recombinase XerD